MEFEKNVILAPYTSFKVGGPAEFFYKATTEDELIEAVKTAHNKGIPYNVLGGGNNVLISDDGIPGLVILNRTKGIEVGDDSAISASGENLAVVIMTASRQGLGGLEEMVGIPGTIGGAVFGNAGSFGKETKDVLEWARVLDNGEVRMFHAPDLNYVYRGSFVKQHPEMIILSAKINFQKKDAATITADVKEYQMKRHMRQPLGTLSCGSVFKNPLGESAGRLIEAAGMKNFRIGGVYVSDKHANFIINDQKGSADDIKKMIDKIKSEVLNKSGVQLEPEVRFFGF